MPCYRNTPEILECCKQKRHALAQDLGVAKAVYESYEKVKSEIKELNDLIQTMEKAAGILTSIGENRQKEAQDQIELLVTQGLQKIFGDHLSFKVVQSVKSRNPVVEFVIQTTMPDGKVRETDIVNAMGGGVAAVAGFLLRLVVLLLDTSRKSAILVLDETFAHVSDSYLPALAEFLREIVDKAQVQIFMVTHQGDFASVADKAYKFTLDANGHTVAKEI